MNDTSISHEDMKFDLDEVYSRDDFLFRLDYLKRDAPPEMTQFFEARIPWAEALPEGTLVGWRKGKDGVIRPMAIIGVDANQGDVM